MSDDLPALQTAVLDDATLARYFQDLALAEALEITLKSGPSVRSNAERVELDQAVELLMSRSVMGVQLRYLHAGQLWCDTLLCSSEGVRLVRMALPG